MEELVLECHEESDWLNQVPALLNFAGSIRIWLLDGEMGAGKTTFTRFLLTALETKDEVNSPTFGLVHQYETTQMGTVYHFDLYRIKGPYELEAIGFQEYLDSGHLCLIEWPSKMEALPDIPYLTLHFEGQGQYRRLNAQRYGN
jgi:tRNA threonylcarbamoyladenosine biosynthesis protein TsaE